MFAVYFYGRYIRFVYVVRSYSVYPSASIFEGRQSTKIAYCDPQKSFVLYVQLPRLRLSNFFFDVKFGDLYESLHRLYYKGTCRTLVMGLVAPITLYTLLRSTRTSICDGLDGVNNEKRAHAM